MLPEQLRELSQLRLQNAKTLLITAEKMIELGDYKSAANRSYFAIFNAMRAELAILGIDNKKHSGIISAFRLNFIKNSIFDDNLSDIITSLFRVRTEADYNDFYIISKTDVLYQLENAKLFVSTVEKHLTSHLD